MKKLLFSITMVFVIVLTACSSLTTGTSTGSTSNSLPIETQIAVGTLKLDGMEQDITAEQAEELLILWQTYKQLGESDTTAQAEVDGLVAQIQETMTADQLQAITDMQITQQEVTTSMQGVTVTASNSGKSAASASSARRGGMPAAGAPPDGGGAPVDGGMPMNMDGGASGSGTGQTQSVQASSGSQSLTKVPPTLVEAVIQSLQEIAVQSG